MFLHTKACENRSPSMPSTIVSFVGYRNVARFHNGNKKVQEISISVKTGANGARCLPTCSLLFSIKVVEKQFCSNIFHIQIEVNSRIL